MDCDSWKFEASILWCNDCDTNGSVKRECSNKPVVESEVDDGLVIASRVVVMLTADRSPMVVTIRVKTLRDKQWCEQGQREEH